MALDKKKAKEQLMALTEEDRTAFLEVVGEVFPPSPPEDDFTPEERTELKGFLASLKESKKKKKGGVLDFLNSLTD